MSIDQWNERTTVLITATFKDEAGTLTTPTSATARIDDDRTGTVLRAATAITPLSTSVTIEVTPDENRILDDQSSWEDRTLTVDFVYGETSRRGTNDYHWRCMNLRGVVS